MVLTLTPTGDDEQLLIRSDVDDPLSARRELERWAAEHGVRIPRMALRLQVVSESGEVQEWTLVPRPSLAEPPPTENRYATRTNERRKAPRELPDFLKLLSSLLAA